MDIKLIIFDLDGTLLNTLDDLTESTNFALSNFNYPLKSTEEIRNFVGNGVAKLIERAIPNGINNPNYNNCLEIFKKHYSLNKYNKTTPYIGILELLKELKKLNYKTAIVSNKFDLAVKELSERYFQNLIDISIGENEAMGIKKKPSADTINKVLNDLNISHENSIYVGDSDVDIMTAKNSNMPCISVTWGFREKEFLIAHNATTIINEPKEILNIIKNLKRDS